MAKIIDIEGVGETYAQKLTEAGIKTTEALLKAGATPKGREELAAKTGLSGKLILEWVNHADLYRIKGVGSEYSDLLEAAGVDTVPELAQRDPKNLFKKLIEVNEAKKLVRRPPLLTNVESWVAQAKELPRVVTY
jgi:predicted flap endonuclease-1-like 5' DNA nuclease